MQQLSSSRLVITPSLQFLLDMVSSAENEVIIVSPWIKVSTLKKIIDVAGKDRNIKWKVLARGKHKDFCEEFSDIEAFQLMIENDCFDLRAIKRLHAKVYIVDRKSSLVTSANLTDGGMEINLEVGIASQDAIETSELIREIDKWFDDATPLDGKWLKEQQRKLLAFRKSKSLEPPSVSGNYPLADEDDKKIASGKYRELPLPEHWRPLLDCLKEKEIETPNRSDYLAMDNVTSLFVDFFEYLSIIPNGATHQKHLISWLVHKQTLDDIAQDEKSRQRISQKIGRPGVTSGEIWKSEEGEKFRQQIISFLTSSIGDAEVKASDVLSSTQLPSLKLSLHDVCQFICGMIENKIIVVNFQARITASNQFVVLDKDIYSILKELDRIFRLDYREFMDIDRFCRIGELENIDDMWFCSRFGILKHVYLSKDRKVGCRSWSLEALAEALAWELENRLSCHYWHYSEMGKALKQLSADFDNTSGHQINSRISNSQDKFHHAGSNGYWQLTSVGDGCRDNKEAIIHILHDIGMPLHYKEITRKLVERKRRVHDSTIYALLVREKDIFEQHGAGNFRLRKNTD